MLNSAQLWTSVCNSAQLCTIVRLVRARMHANCAQLCTGVQNCAYLSANGTKKTKQVAREAGAVCREVEGAACREVAGAALYFGPPSRIEDDPRWMMIVDDG